MYARVVGLIVRRGFRRLNAGDAQGALGMFAPDARFVFPGRHSFAADLADPQRIAAWFDRFVALGPHFDILDVMVAGPPWNLRVAVRFDDQIASRDGTMYINNGMQYLRLRWGRVHLDRLFVDTQAVAEFDAAMSG